MSYDKQPISASLLYVTYRIALQNFFTKLSNGLYH